MPYGTIIPDLKINGAHAPYPVVNERGIRAAAGLMFAIGMAAFFVIFFTKNYTILYILVPVFWLEFFIKSVFQPHLSPFSIIGELLVKNQTPEYVGAIQKRFAWSLGLGMATIMIIVAIVLGIKGWLPALICWTCLILMWMESAMGLCVGCKIYQWLLSKKLIKEPSVRPACPGGVCSLKK